MPNDLCYNMAKDAYLCHLLFKIICLFLHPGKKSIRLAPFQAGDTDQLWTIHGDRIVSRVNPDRVIDIKRQSNQNAAKLVTKDWQGDPSQRWAQEYID